MFGEMTCDSFEGMQEHDLDIALFLLILLFFFYCDTILQI